MRIQTNIGAVNAQRNLSATQRTVDRSMARLSSGFRINSAADDAAGLTIANKMRGDVRSLQMAQRNAAQAGSVLQIADGATATVSQILDRMKELATQSSSANTTADARAKIQAEFKELQAEITRTVDATKFQGQTLLNGSFGSTTDSTSTLLANTSANDGDLDGAAEKSIKKVDLSGATVGDYTLTTAAGTAGSKNTTFTFTKDGVAQTLTLELNDVEAGSTLKFDKLGITLTLGDDFGRAASVAGAPGLEDNTVKSAEIAALSGDILKIKGGTGDFRVGLGTAADSKISVGLGDVSLGTTGLDLAASTLDTVAGAEATLTKLDAAYTKLNGVIGDIGAAMNRLEFASSNLSSIVQNTMAAESVIRDTDMAHEMTQFSKAQIIAQAGTAMLAQANQSGQGVLQLLRG